jgi:hypothetical protein
MPRLAGFERRSTTKRLLIHPVAQMPDARTLASRWHWPRLEIGSLVATHHVVSATALRQTAEAYI